MINAVKVEGPVEAGYQQTSHGSAEGHGDSEATATSDGSPSRSVLSDSLFHHFEADHILHSWEKKNPPAYE